MTDTIIIHCQCGENYLVGSEKIPQGTLRCVNCGELLHAPDADRNEPPDHRGPRLVVKADRTVRAPDELMATVSHSILAKTLLFSFVLHIALLGLTSFSLYSDWAKYGFMPPHEIKEVKKQKRQADEEAQREEERLKRVNEERAKVADREEAKETQGGVGATAPEGTGKNTESVPEVVREATEVSNERPDTTDYSLDSAIDLLD